MRQKLGKQYRQRVVSGFGGQGDETSRAARHLPEDMLSEKLKAFRIPQTGLLAAGAEEPGEADEASE